MGTRSLTNIYDTNWGKPGRGPLLCTIYRQMDGYPTGHGKDLADVVKPLRMVNGITLGDTPVANGMGCLAAQIIGGLKDGPGSIYMSKPGEVNCGEDYMYDLWLDALGKVRIQVWGVGFSGDDRDPPKQSLYKGLMSKFDPEKVEEEDNS